VREDALTLQKQVPKDDALRVEEHLSAVRDLERAVDGLPAEYRRVDPPDYDGDMKDWPRIAKLQSDLLAQALVTRQTRVASYMVTKGQGLARFPWLGLTAARHHDYTHADGKAPGADGADGQRVLRDITRWHADEFAYLLAKLKSIPEGDGTVLDHTCLIYAHEHAEANPLQLQRPGDDRGGALRAAEDRHAYAGDGHHRRSIADGRGRGDGCWSGEISYSVEEDYGSALVRRGNVVLSNWEPRQVDTVAARGTNYRLLRIRMLITMRTMIFITALKGLSIAEPPF
jgi:hypothetical protein